MPRRSCEASASPKRAPTPKREQNLPRKPLSAYSRWLVSNRGRIVKELGPVDGKEKAKVHERAAQMWNALEEKSKLEAEAAEALATWKEEVEACKKTAEDIEFQSGVAAQTTKRPLSTNGPLSTLKRPKRRLPQVPKSEDDIPAFLAQFPTSAIMRELARRLKVTDVQSSPVARHANQNRQDMGNVALQSQASKIAVELPGGVDAAMDAQPVEDVSLKASVCTADVGVLPPGFRVWFTDKRRAKLVAHLGNDHDGDEENLIKEALVFFGDLDDADKRKYANRAV